MRERETDLEIYDYDDSGDEIDLSHLSPEEAEKVRRIIRLNEEFDQKINEQIQIEEDISWLEEDIEEESDGLSAEALDILHNLGM
ncbi:hypothetical protein HYW46_01935 [Candidatus Daviesbacteria bacterium]|nr:hypothetical protein [Candidatus Daviesbacteria bacterium]